MWTSQCRLTHSLLPQTSESDRLNTDRRLWERRWLVDGRQLPHGPGAEKSLELASTASDGCLRSTIAAASSMKHQGRTLRAFMPTGWKDMPSSSTQYFYLPKNGTTQPADGSVDFIRCEYHSIRMFRRAQSAMR